MIKKRLTTIGSSFGVIIPKIFLEEMGIENPIMTPDIEMEIDNGVLKIKKSNISK